MRHIIEMVVGLPEMAGATAFSGDLAELALRWIDGVPVTELLGDEDEGTDVLSSRVEDILTYLSPWGASAYLRIARAALEIDIPSSIRAIPALLKYGVPTIEATWVQSAGVRSRRASIALARDFVATEELRTPSAVRRWLRHLDPEDLMAEYGIDRATAVSAVGAIVRSSRNVLLDLHEAGELLPRTVTVRLRDPVFRSGVVDDVRHGATALSLRRDYLDGSNRNAIFVEQDGRHVGRLPWSLAQVLAVEMDAGRRFSAAFVSVNEGAGTLEIQVAQA